MMNKSRKLIHLLESSEISDGLFKRMSPTAVMKLFNLVPQGDSNPVYVHTSQIDDTTVVVVVSQNTVYKDWYVDVGFRVNYDQEVEDFERYFPTQKSAMRVASKIASLKTLKSIKKCLDDKMFKPPLMTGRY